MLKLNALLYSICYELKISQGYILCKILWSGGGGIGMAAGKKYYLGIKNKKGKEKRKTLHKKRGKRP